MEWNCNFYNQEIILLVVALNVSNISSEGITHPLTVSNVAFPI